MYRFYITLFFVILSFAAANSTSTRNVVEYLPGFQGPLPFHLETGYVGVDENEDVQLFYYFIRSESNPEVDPILVWISGGPGCSANADLFGGVGPLDFVTVHYNGSLPTLILQPNSWTKMASIIFLDTPVGTGFSYARTKPASHSSDIQVAYQTDEFIRKWLESQSEFKSNPIYLVGGSYSGILVPIIGQQISNGNEDGIVPYINLKGYLLGSPMAFPEEVNYKIRFANGMGFISDELYKSLSSSCRGEYRPDYISVNNIKCQQNLELYNESIRGINIFNTLEPDCSDLASPIKLPSQKRLKDSRPLSAFYCRFEILSLISNWIQDASVREALHIREGTVEEWIACNFDINFTRTIYDVRPYHLNLSEKGFRSLIYSGDHDMVIPFQSTEAWIKDLNYSIIDQWRSWKLHGQIAGYTQTYSNMMTYITVKGSGHGPPTYKPEECSTMFKRWISHQPL